MTHRVDTICDKRVDGVVVGAILVGKVDGRYGRLALSHPWKRLVARPVHDIAEVGYEGGVPGKNGNG